MGYLCSVLPYFFVLNACTLRHDFKLYKDNLVTVGGGGTLGIFVRAVPPMTLKVDPVLE